MLRTLAIVLLLAACGKKPEAAPKPEPIAAGTAAPTPATNGSSAKPAPTPTPTPVDTPGSIDASAPVAAAAHPPGTGADGRPLYYDRALAAEDLDGRTLRDLSLMRNTIFARGGNPFRKPWLRAYFGAQPWYHALAQTDDAKLTAIDHANARLIADREASFARDQLLAMKDAIAAKGAPSAEDEVELALISTRLGTWVGGDAPAAAGDAPRSPLEDPSRLDALLTLDDLESLSRRDLRILRNTVYARRVARSSRR